jgi:hypothetical protein
MQVIFLSSYYLESFSFIIASLSVSSIDYVLLDDRDYNLLFYVDSNKVSASGCQTDQKK